MAVSNAVSFDRFNASFGYSLGRTAALIGGLTFAPKMTGSVWLKRLGDLNDLQVIFQSSSGLRIRFESDNTFSIRAPAFTGAVVDLRTSAIIDNNWHHILFSFDSEDINKKHLYVDDVLDMNVVNFPGVGSPQMNIPGQAMGTSATGGSALLDADISEFWLSQNDYFDLSIQDNRRKFISSDKKPIPLGDNGELPTTQSPLMYMGNPSATYNINLGTGGDFTFSGILGVMPAVTGLEFGSATEEKKKTGFVSLKRKRQDRRDRFLQFRSDMEKPPEDIIAEEFINKMLKR